MKVICYKRVSTDDQADRGFSLQHQEEMLLRWCEINHHEVVQIYTEDYSGKTFERPEWKKLMVYCRKNKTNVDLILANRWDRFSRNQYEALKVIKELQSMGISVNTVEQPLDLSNADNKILLSLYLSIPEVENDKNSIRTKEGSRRARKEGCWTGQAPRGYRNVRVDKKSSLEPSDDAPLIIQSFEKMASGLYTADEVRRWLNHQGIKLSKNMFPNIIRNVVYTGQILVKEFKKEPCQLVRGLHQPLISEELFAEANRVLDGRKRNMKFHDDKSDLYPLKGHLRCAKHNLSLSAGPSKGRYGIYHYYVCTVKNDRCKRYPIDKVHTMVEEKLRDIQFSAQVFKAYRSILERFFENEDVDRKRNIVKTKTEIEKKTEQRNRLQILLLDGKLTTEEYRELKTPIDSDLFRLEKHLSSLNEETSPFKDYITKHVPLMENLLEFYRGCDGKTKKRILSCIFSEKIYFQENGDAAISYHQPIVVLMNTSKVLERSENKKEVISDLLFNMAPRVGLEPTTP
jgi:site-specific DNA recombinase